MLICVVCILFLSFLWQANTPYNFKQDNMNSTNRKLQTSSSNPAEQRWNTTWGGAGDDHSPVPGPDLAVDSSGNIYLAGTTSNFGAGGDDIALIKYNSLGVQQWNRTWGGINNDSACAIALDSSNNIYITGTYDRSGVIPPISGNIVLLKYNSSGQLQWNATWGGSGLEKGNAIALDSSGNIYIAGLTISFAVGYTDMVLVKYNNLGEQQWNTTWGRIYQDQIFSIALDSSENIYATGYTSNSAAGEIDIVLVKYNNLGQQQWNTTWGGSEPEAGCGIALDSSENVYVCGFTLEEAGIPLLKYNSLGLLQWSRIWGGSDDWSGWDIALDSSDNLYVSGGTNSSGSNDIALMKYNSLGQPQWNTTWGGSDRDDGWAIALDSADNIFITGDTASFGAGGIDMVLIKYTESSGGNGTERIPGYDLFLLLGAVCIISTIIIKKRDKSLLS